MPKISIRDVELPRGHKGWITPDGKVVPLDNEYQVHGQWVLDHLDLIQKLYPDFPSLSELKKLKSRDDVRDKLAEKGWVHIYSSRELTVYRLDEKTRRNIIEAIQTRKFLPNYPLRIYESSSDYVFTLREENIADKDIYAFEID